MEKGMPYKVMGKSGFTLAEVLITLGIIGVVAAMTIPTLVASLNHKVLESQFKKTYAELNVAARTFFSEEEISVHDADGDLYGAGNGSKDSSALLDKFMTYFKGKTKSTQSRWNSFDSAHNITQKNLNGQAVSNYPCDQSHVVTDMAGRLYAMDDTTTSYNNLTFGPKICVDINGIQQPNRLGYDRFVFVFTEDNAVIPYTGTSWSDITQNKTDDEDISKYCSKVSSSPAFSCAYFALKNISPDGTKKYWSGFLK